MDVPKARSTGCTKVWLVDETTQVGSTLPAGPEAACDRGDDPMRSAAVVQIADAAHYGGADLQVRPLRPNLKVRPSGWYKRGDLALLR
jgi:hypothetical protein